LHSELRILKNISNDRNKAVNDAITVILVQSNLTNVIKLHVLTEHKDKSKLNWRWS